MSVTLIRGLYEYHRWANHRLLEHAATLGDGVLKPVGGQFSVPTLKGMFAHLCGADWIWLERWKGGAPERLPGDADFPTFAAVRERWSAVADEQKTFVEGLREADLERVVRYRSTLFPDRDLSAPLGTMLQHVANHATHHRSEIATMLTMISGSPPSTDRIVHHLVTTGQLS